MSDIYSENLRQPTDVASPTVLEIFNPIGIHSEAGLPFVARSPDDYGMAGGLRLIQYDRHDSPSRDKAGLPYDDTWFEHLRGGYGEALRLLEELRQEYISNCTSDGNLTGKDIITIYHMGIQLPQFLLWRGDEPIKNGEIPDAMAILRQALLGIGSVLLYYPEEDIPHMTGSDVSNIAEKNGDLISQEFSAFPDMPRRVCPASPTMIAGLAEALIHGQEKRGVSLLLERHNVNIKKLQTFVSFVSDFGQETDRLESAIIALAKEVPAFDDPTTKLARYDEMLAKFAALIDSYQEIVFSSLDRTDKPPRMNLRRLYKFKNDYRRGRLEIINSDDPAKYTADYLMSLEPPLS